MGASTGIAWTRSTFNPWIGCTKVSPGCDHCYAEALDARYRWGGAAHWGAGVPRHQTGESQRKQVMKWNRIAGMERDTGSCVDGSGRLRGANGMSHGWTKPGFWPVFPSLCDPFDNEVPASWRNDFLGLIYDSPNLTWLLLTKRIGNVPRLMEECTEPGHEWKLPPNVWIGASIVNQDEADRDLPKLMAVRGVAKRFVSYEPALGPVDFDYVRARYWATLPALWKVNYPDGRRPWVDQIIVGGESKQGKHDARPFDIGWARRTVNQCRAAGVAVFVKQLGSHPLPERLPGTVMRNRLPLNDRAGADPAEWPADLRIQEFPT